MPTKDPARRREQVERYAAKCRERPAEWHDQQRVYWREKGRKYRAAKAAAEQAALEAAYPHDGRERPVTFPTEEVDPESPGQHFAKEGRSRYPGAHNMRVMTFLSRIEKTSTCWNWIGYKKGGYGSYSGFLAHRLAYEKFVGPIPANHEIDHLCRNTLCVNPDHLEPVSPAENDRRKVAARTHCKHGHEYTPENTRLDPHGRVCRKCVSIRSAQSKRKRNALRRNAV